MKKKKPLRLVRSAAADQLVKDLQEGIRSGRLRPGQAILSERRLSEQYGISPVTVQRALARLAAEGWIDRRPRSGTFVRRARRGKKPSGAAARRQVRVVFYMPVTRVHPLVDHYSRLMFEIEQTLAERGWDMLFSSLSRLKLAGRGNYLQSREMPEAGRLLIGPVKRALAEGPAGGSPSCVYVDHHPQDGTCDAVVSDDFDGVHKVVNRLVRLGHERIAYVGGANTSIPPADGRPWPNSILREQAWREAMHRAGLEPKEAWSILVSATESGGGFRAYDVWKTLHPRPTAIIAFSYDQAEEVVLEARRHGVRIPEDLSVAAFGLPERKASAPKNELALIIPDLPRLGRRGAELLLNRIEHPEAPVREVIVPVEFQEGSTMAKASAERVKRKTAKG